MIWPLGWRQPHDGFISRPGNELNYVGCLKTFARYKLTFKRHHPACYCLDMRRVANQRPTALICGITGQDGCYLAAHLLKRGYNVVGTSRTATNDRLSGLRQLGIDKQVRIAAISLTDAKQITTLIERVQPEFIFHLAGQSSVAMSFEKPDEAFTSIATSTHTLLEAIRTVRQSARLFVAGSSEIFGRSQIEPVTCQSRLDPQNPYAISKTTAFRMVQHYRDEHGLFACTGVLFNHESPLRPEQFVAQKIVNAACDIAAGRQQELRLGDLSIERDWGWAPEFVLAMEKMLTRDNPEDFIIATGFPARLDDFVARAFAAVGIDWRNHVIRDESFVRPNDGHHPLASTAETHGSLGWAATIFMPEVVNKLVLARLASKPARHQQSA